MKSIRLFGVLLAASSLQAQTSTQAPANNVTLPVPTPYAVVSRDANSAVWQRTTYDRAPDGSLVPHIYQYKEIANGLNHLVNGQYAPSSENVEISSDGSSASSTNGAHQLYFPGDIRDGVIKLVEADGKVIETAPICLALSDGSNSVLLALVTNSTGAILPSGNEVIYANAFSGLNADIMFSNTKAGMSQDIVLRQQLPDPASLNLNAAKLRLQMITEFFTVSPPAISAIAVPTAAGNLEDDSLNFGLMRMGRGKAFLLGSHSPSVRVLKRWAEIGDRRFLIKEVPMVSIAPAMDSLPPYASKAGATMKSTLSKNLILPPPRLVRASPKKFFWAQATPPKQGLVLDYVTLNAFTNDFTFQSDTTYYVSGPVYLEGSSTFEGGAVIKYAVGTSIWFDFDSKMVNWQTGPYRPIIFTAKDDNTVGENISGSTGNPTDSYYANPALGIYPRISVGPIFNFRILYAQKAFELDYGGCELYDGQIVACQNGIMGFGGTFHLRNVLFGGVQTNLSEVILSTVDAQNCTFDSSLHLITGQNSSASFTNCIFANISAWADDLASGISGGPNGFVNCQAFGTGPTVSTSPFQTMRAGNYYLKNDCAFLNAGTADIDAVLQADLQTKTVFPPAFDYANTTVSGIWTPQVQRDTNPTPSLGYHYAPIDYMVNGVSASGTLTLSSGVAVAAYGSGFNSFSGGTLISQGTALAHNQLCFFRAVQEQPITLWCGGLIEWTGYDPPSVLKARFMDFNGMSGLLNLIDGYSLQLQLQDCYVGPGWVSPNSPNSIQSYTNNLFERVYLNIDTFDWMCPVYLYNNTVRNSTVWINAMWELSGYRKIKANLFDNSTVNVVYPAYADYGYNAYYDSPTTLTPYRTGDFDLGTLTYANGPLGNRYIDSSTAPTLVDSGDITADRRGLFHFTTQTNQTIEAGSQVDIGYHYVALDPDGSLPTTGVPGTPDYLLDSILPTISISTPANNSTFNTSRINVKGTFTDAYLKQITVNGAVAYVSGNSFEAMNVPLAAGANMIIATAEDVVGKTATAIITVTGSATPVDPVQLQGTPIAGFVPLNVNYTVSASVPGTLQQVLYDFNGDGTSDFTATDLNPIQHTYSSAGEYFPMVTIVTTAGRFSSSGGWNSTDPNRLRINVQIPPVLQNTIAITDPVDLKCDSSGNLYVLSRSTATIQEYNSSGTLIRSLSGIGTAPRGLDVDGPGNVYVADTGDNQVLKFNPTTSSFQLDATFGAGGHLGNDDQSSGSGDGEFDGPFDAAISPDGGAVSVSDSNNHRIQQFASADGTFLGSFGQQGSDVGQFNTPKGLTYDSSGYLYIVDSGNNRIVVALSSTVIGTCGTSGTGLGQFQGAINLGVGDRGICVADTGNNRVQSFEPLATGDGASSTPFTVRGAFSTELSLSQPNAVAPVADLLKEKFYLADTGNNRVILVEVTGDNPLPTWNNMVAHITAGDISGAISSFSSESANGYRSAYCTIGIDDLTSDINAIGTLSPVYIRNDTAEYYFQQTIGGQQLLFPVDFVKENGVWKISGF
jgi:Glucodextranase, domain B